MAIKHIQCDIFKSGADVIGHQVNCEGVMGSGMAAQVKKKYPNVYKAYKDRCEIYSPKALLGTSQFVSTKPESSFLGIFNLFGQEKFGYDGKCYTNYTALYKCLEKMKKSMLLAVGCTSKDRAHAIAFPYLMGCHRGGGDWNIVYGMIEEIFSDYNGDILICEYNGG